MALLTDLTAGDAACAAVDVRLQSVGAMIGALIRDAL
jgi:hypothetical protein